jgi:excisionase family DNA binding protein
MSRKSELLTVDEAADALSLSKHTVRAWIAARRLGHVRLGRALRVPVSEVNRVVQRGTVPALALRQ